MKLCYLAHPIGGDVPGNVAKVKALLADLTKRFYPSRIFSAPYLNSLEFLDDSNVRDKDIGFAINKAYFNKGAFDEIWLCGDRISNGMMVEIGWAKERGVKIIAYGMPIVDEYLQLISESHDHGLFIANNL